MRRDASNKNMSIEQMNMQLHRKWRYYAHEIPFSRSYLRSICKCRSKLEGSASIGAAFRISERLDLIASVGTCLKLLLIKRSISFILLTAIDNLSCCQLNESNQFTMLLKWARLLPSTLAIWIDLPQATRHILHIIMSHSNVVVICALQRNIEEMKNTCKLKLFAVDRKTQINGGEAKKSEFEIIGARRRQEERLNWWIEIRQHAVYIYLFRNTKRLILHSIAVSGDFVWVCLHCLPFPPAIAAGQSPTIWLNDG